MFTSTYHQTRRYVAQHSRDLATPPSPLCCRDLFSERYLRSLENTSPPRNCTFSNCSIVKAPIKARCELTQKTLAGTRPASHSIRCSTCPALASFQLRSLAFAVALLAGLAGLPTHYSFSCMFKTRRSVTNRLSHLLFVRYLARLWRLAE
jgi:hypothetical protein